MPISAAVTKTFIQGKGKSKKEFVQISFVHSVNNSTGGNDREGAGGSVEVATGSSLDAPFKLKLVSMKATVTQAVASYNNTVDIRYGFAMGNDKAGFSESRQGAVSELGGDYKVLGYANRFQRAGYGSSDIYERNYDQYPVTEESIGDKIKLGYWLTMSNTLSNDNNLELGMVFTYEKEKMTRAEYIEHLAVHSCSC